MKNLFSLIFLCFLLLPCRGQESSKDYSEAFALIEVWLDAQKDYEKLPGISAAVVEDQKVLWSGAFGQANMEKKVPMTPETLCSICSISKLFTAVAVMTLYEEGKLRLDDTVEDLLPAYDVNQQFPDSGPITVRSLLTHSSGLPREANAPYWTGPDFPFPTREEVYSGLKDQQTLYPASTYYQYSNLALTLLGEIVEQVSGQSYSSYVQEHILTPLQLDHTRTNLPKDLYGNKLAIGYSALNRKGDRPPVNFFQANGIQAAAGYSSNVLDLGKFASWQFRLRDTTAAEILKPATLKLMQQVHFMDPNWKNSWGLGFVVYKGANGTTWVGHGGSCPGYRSTLQLDLKNKRAYAVNINAGGTNPNKYSSGIYAILNKVKSGKSANSDIPFEDYSGHYDARPWGSEEYIGSWEGQLLMVNLPSGDPADDISLFKHVDGDTFRRVRDDGELGETVVFERNAEGKVYRYKQHGNYTYKKKP
ncbi:CubicO group peptidase, beta-lactamase class C family [Muriicola jejuensis]|uniref:Serine hydrolase n=1 Tax=Muriicola jejuensis TaxID=504488 RepID=A0A6P0UBY0_9FLAO|nr:serine hydrolase [Muriicola jejuensis]NER10791.1 serine hydrolase [Muriicola jejuensis]SMP16247.1 CubicO group peptidase, beta-lactamase class C family [Muriicola jejuensis]